MELNSKLSRAVGMLSKIRHYVEYETLRMIYHGIFSSILMYGSQIWGQHNGIVKKLQKLQNKALRLMTFSSFRAKADPLFKQCDILKIADDISLQNFIFAHDSLNNNLPSSIKGQVSMVNIVRNSRSEMLHQLNRIRSKTIIYGTNSIKSKSVDVWNFVNQRLHHLKLHQKSRTACKTIVKTFLLDRY